MAGLATLICAHCFCKESCFKVGGPQDLDAVNDTVEIFSEGSEVRCSRLYLVRIVSKGDGSNVLRMSTVPYVEDSG